MCEPPVTTLYDDAQGPEQGQGGDVRGGNDDGDRSLGGGGPGRRRGGGGFRAPRRAPARRSRSVRRASVRPAPSPHPRETVQAHDDDGDDGTLGGTPRGILE